MVTFKKIKNLKIMENKAIVDRVIFNSTELPNGITLFEKKTSDPFVCLQIIFPVGTANNAGAIIPGSFHFLEHMILDGKQGKICQHIIEDDGGKFNAGTSSFYSSYEVESTSENFSRDLQHLYANIFEPSFDESDIKMQRKIIENERKAQSPCFPGTNSVSQYLESSFKQTYAHDLKQRFGESSDLLQITSEYLLKLHSYYFNKNTKVVIAGNYDEKLVRSVFEKINTKEYVLSEEYQTSKWINKDFHIKEIIGTERFLYNFAGFGKIEDIREYLKLSFLQRYLFNSSRGPIYKWLRDEINIYGIDFESANDGREFEYSFEFPLDTMEEVEMVKSQLFGKIKEAVTNAELLEKYKRLVMGRQVFDFQSLQSVFNFAASSVRRYGHVINEEMIISVINEITVSSLADLAEKFFSKESLGQCVIIPKK